MYLYKNEIFRVSVRNLTERVPDSFQLAVPKPVPYPNRFTPSQKPRKNFVPQIQKKEKTSFQGVVKYLLLTAFDLAEYHGMPFPPPRGPRHRDVHGAVRQEPRNELAPKLPLT